MNKPWKFFLMTSSIYYKYLYSKEQKKNLRKKKGMMMRKKTKRKRMGSRKGEKMKQSGIMGRLENQIKFKCEK